MQKIIIGIFLFFLITQNISANFLNQREQKNLENIKIQLQNISQNKDQKWFELINTNLSKNISRSRNNLKLWYILSQIQQELKNLQEIQFPSIDQNIPQEIEQQNYSDTNKNFQKEFFENHGKNITTSLEMPEKCYEFYDIIDEMGKQNNFPTALIISTWSKELNCNFSNPANGWWLYQITSAYYVPWDITIEDFKKMTQDFIDFSKWKWASYEKNPRLRERFWIEKIEITYDFFTLESLQLHAILYNGVWKTTTLSTNTYANNNINSSITGKSDWLITRFLKVIHYEWEK